MFIDKNFIQFSLYHTTDKNIFMLNFPQAMVHNIIAIPSDHLLSTMSLDWGTTYWAATSQTRPYDPCTCYMTHNNHINMRTLFPWLTGAKDWGTQPGWSTLSVYVTLSTVISLEPVPSPGSCDVTWAFMTNKVAHVSRQQGYRAIHFMISKTPKQACDHLTTGLLP